MIFKFTEDLVGSVVHVLNHRQELRGWTRKKAPGPSPRVQVLAAQLLSEMKLAGKCSVCSHTRKPWWPRVVSRCLNYCSLTVKGWNQKGWIFHLGSTISMVQLVGIQLFTVVPYNPYSARTVMISPLSFLVLVIWVFSFFLVSPAKGLSIFWLIFSKPAFGFVDFLCRLSSLYFKYFLSFLLLPLGSVWSSLSSSLSWKVRLLIWDRFFFNRGIYGYTFPFKHGFSCIP